LPPRLNNSSILAKMVLKKAVDAQALKQRG
jgi:hypothetical protein